MEGPSSFSKQRRSPYDKTDTSTNASSWTSKMLPNVSAGGVFFILASLLVCRHEVFLWETNNATPSTTRAAYLDPLPEVYQQQQQQLTTEQQHRFLQDVILRDGPPDINDDVTRDETCKSYMSKFLNGTTDFKDECQGMYNAYTAADCADDTHTTIMAHQQHQGQNLYDMTSNKRHHKKDDKQNVTDDDVMIDDFYEKWECCSSIYEYYNTHCHEPQLDSPRLLAIVGVLVLCSMVKSFLHQVMGWEWLPDAAIYVLVGAVTGGICRLVAPHVVTERFVFNNDLMLHILLPPIVFQAALKINKRSFRRDVFAILSFAIFGTVLSSVAVGLITYYLTNLSSTGTRLPLLDSLLFGSLISSIDPVATLGILSSVGVSQRDTLYTLIFGESLLNDGVAIVLFDVLVQHLGDQTVVDKATVTEVLRRVLAIACGSIMIGVFCGACCAIYFYNLWGKHTAVTEVAIFFSWALIPFYVADMLGGSGIIAIMVMGFFLDYYVVGGNQSEEGEWMDFMHLRCTTTTRRAGAGAAGALRSEGDLMGVVHQEQEEPGRCDRLKQAWKRIFSGRGHILSKSRHHVGFVAEVIADIMETAIFTYLGLFLFNDNNQWDWRLNGIAIFGCVSSRLGMVVLISTLINVFVFCDVEGVLGRFFRKVWSDLCNSQSNNNEVLRSVRTTMSAPLLGGNHYDDPPTGDDDDDDDDDSTSSVSRRYLDAKTQVMLLLAGVRGAVSFALVANIPVYNVMTKKGSQYKAELKAMTSASIVFTLFVFGAMTYFIVRRDESHPNERIAGSLTHRLESLPLASDNEGEEEEEDSDAMGSSAMALEIESSQPRRQRVISFE